MPPVVKFLVAAVVSLVGVIVGLIAGILAVTNGKSWQGAVRDGGVAFGGTVTVITGVLVAVHLL
jgi:hypothetical protein